MILLRYERDMAQLLAWIKRKVVQLFPEIVTVGKKKILRYYEFFACQWNLIGDVCCMLCKLLVKYEGLLNTWNSQSKKKKFKVIKLKNYSLPVISDNPEKKVQGQLRTFKQIILESFLNEKWSIRKFQSNF